MNYRYAVIKKYYTDRFLPFFRTRNHISFNAVKSPENRERLPVFAILTRRNKKIIRFTGQKTIFRTKTVLSPLALRVDFLSVFSSVAALHKFLDFPTFFLYN